MNEMILPSEVETHKDFNDTWLLDNWEIEDKIKELRKEIYRLQKSREKQPFLICFRDRMFSSDTDKARCDIFYGFKFGKKRFTSADSWKPITKEQAEQVKKKYKLTENALKVIDKTIQKGTE